LLLPFAPLEITWDPRRNERTSKIKSHNAKYPIRHLTNLSNTHQRHLFEVCKMTAHKWLFESQFEYAIPAALQALRYVIDLHGKDAINVVPTYLLLGEASIGIRH
jgi:hypothetical protein